MNFYIVECIIKGIGLGLEKYVEDDWNKFDLSLVTLSLISNLFESIITILKTARSAKAAKIIRLTKLNRLFKMCSAVKKVQCLHFLIQGAETFSQVKLLIFKIFSCLPLSKS